MTHKQFSKKGGSQSTPAKQAAAKISLVKARAALKRKREKSAKG
jgi:hypothetical protein